MVAELDNQNMKASPPCPYLQEPSTHLGLVKYNLDGSITEYMAGHDQPAK